MNVTCPSNVINTWTSFSDATIVATATYAVPVPQLNLEPLGTRKPQKNLEKMHLPSSTVNDIGKNGGKNGGVGKMVTLYETAWPSGGCD